MKKVMAFALALVIICLTACTDDTKEKEVKFTLKVTDSEGNTTSRSITTEKEKVGDALRDEGIITETGYITVVNGATADWDKDQAYWKLVINGEDAMEGVDDIKAVEGSVYEFIYTKG